MFQDIAKQLTQVNRLPTFPSTGIQKTNSWMNFMNFNSSASPDPDPRFKIVGSDPGIVPGHCQAAHTSQQVSNLSQYSENYTWMNFNSIASPEPDPRFEIVSPEPSLNLSQ